MKSILIGDLIQWSSNVGVTVDEFSVEIHGSQETVERSEALVGVGHSLETFSLAEFV